MAKRAVIFDLDGTVWDSWPFYAAVLAELTGWPGDDLHGALRDGESIAHLHNRLSISRSRFVDHAVDRADRLQLYGDIANVLRELKAAGRALGVVTSLPGSIANPLLDRKGLRELFDLVICAKFGMRPKPNPSGLRDCLRGLGNIEPSNALYVGDAANDAGAARAAGTQFALASYGYGDHSIDHDFLLEGPTDLLGQ